MKNDEIKGNPFSVGDRVICIDDNWTKFEGMPDNMPKKGMCYIVSGIHGKFITLQEFPEIGDVWPGFHMHNFAPIQDATEMQEDETCEQVAKETEAEYANRKEQKIEVVI